ncbi:MAG: FKBP-type peptidyl-prolyl cis-trans isomerase [Chitinophagaceae bacterium]
MKKQAIYFLVVVLASALAFASCKNNVDYKKTKSGVMYKIFGNGKDSVVKTGNIMKINFTIKIGSSDSVLQTSVGKLPLFVPIEGSVPADAYSPLEVFSMLRKGDSAVIVQMVDTLLKKNPGGQMPPFFKKGDKLITIVKVLDVFGSQELASKDREAETEKEKVRMDKEVEEDLVKANTDMAAWLATKKIEAVKTGKGTYVVVKDPGTGMQAATGKYVTVRYEGKTLSNGEIFQSTLDPKAPPFTFKIGTVGPGGAIPGWDEGLPLFKKGGKGTLYIPGPLAYGKNPPQGSVFKPNEALIFDIVVVDVSDTQPAPPQQQQQQQMPPEVRAQMEKQMREQQQQEQKKPGN